MPRLERNGPEAACFWALSLTWPFYYLGALYIVGPALGWGLFFTACLALFLGPAMAPGFRVKTGVPLVITVWWIGMIVMLIALWVGHVEWELGSGEITKSTIGWMKGWALAAVFPFVGAMLPIRREYLIRAQSIVGLVTLILTPMMVAAALIHLPSKLFVSPLSVVGGPGPEYFAIYLYTIDPETSTPRWQFYAPWSPFAGLLGTAAVCFAIEEKTKFWMIVGILGGLALILLSKSRMSLIAVIVCSALPRIIPLFTGVVAWRWLAVAAASLAVFGEAALNMIDNSIHAFKEARVSSSRVRDALQRIALDRWGREARWFGHGAVERGPHLVEYMPIGSHHTWFGLLYVKGLVGVGSLLAPMVYEFLFTLIDAGRSSRGRLPFAIILLFVQLTFGENMEIETYLFWPCFVMLGIHAREVEEERIARVARRERESMRLAEAA